MCVASLATTCPDIDTSPLVIVQTWRSWTAITPGKSTIVERTAAEIDAYFTGELKRFTVPIIDPGTEFQRTVWTELMNIPYGSTASYKDIAHRIGRPTAMRAVARANGDNRLAIIIPCHRVIGADGSLTGYGGGLWRKKRLLDHEQSRDV